MMAKYTFIPALKRSYHRALTMPKTEIMLIIILFRDSGYSCLKHFYMEKVCRHMRHLFPYVVSYNHFVEPGKEVVIILDLYITFWAYVQVLALLTVLPYVYAGARVSLS